MNLDKLKEPLKIDEIDFRIQSINKGKYATILAYKDARVDMQRLDNVVGVLNWKREHTRDNKNCIVSIWCSEKKQWISKEDTGTESNTEKQKGLASDSFKRACFNIGIGRELYDYPIISIKLNDNEVSEYQGKFKPSFNFKLKEWKWTSEFEDGRLKYLACKDNNGKKRFEWSSVKGSINLKNSNEVAEKPKEVITEKDYNMLKLPQNHKYIDWYIQHREMSDDQRKGLEKLKEIV